MSKHSRTTLVTAIIGLVFLFAGLRDRYWPGHVTLNRATPSQQEIGVALALGLFFLGVAGFRLIGSKPPS